MMLSLLRTSCEKYPVADLVLQECRLSLTCTIVHAEIHLRHLLSKRPSTCVLPLSFCGHRQHVPPTMALPLGHHLQPPCTRWFACCLPSRWSGVSSIGYHLDLAASLAVLAGWHKDIDALTHSSVHAHSWPTLHLGFRTLYCEVLWLLATTTAFLGRWGADAMRIPRDVKSQWKSSLSLPSF